MIQTDLERENKKYKQKYNNSPVFGCCWHRTLNGSKEIYNYLKTKTIHGLIEAKKFELYTVVNKIKSNDSILGYVLCIADILCDGEQPRIHQ